MVGFLDMTRENKVNQFRKAGGKKDFSGAPDDMGMIFDCIDEEFNEFIEAAYDYQDAVGDGSDEEMLKTRAQLCKEWADLQYVVSQAAVYFDIPADPSFNRVHDSNMTKVVDGKVIYRDDGKILKPDTYKAPDMRGL
jgi:predicted HAD superfamily Cof-like phosphohydrolase